MMNPARHMAEQPACAESPPTSRLTWFMPLLVLTLTNILAHFLPFERAALAPDEYAHLLLVQGKSLRELVTLALSNADRPLNYLFVFFQERIVGLNPTLGLLLVVLSSACLTIVVYCLLGELLQEKFTALLGALIYLLLPNKLDMYHTPIYVNMNVAFTLYVLSLLCFIRYRRSGQPVTLLASLLTYTMAIFWYEVGFFLPLVLGAYAVLYDKRGLRTALYFLIPSVVYVLFRLTGAFGLSSASSATATHHISVANIPHNVLWMIPNHYVGRYVIRAILYGMYKFPSIEVPWLFVVLGLNALIVPVFVWWTKRHQLVPIKPRLIVFAGTMFVTFLIPNTFYLVESRHTTLSSIGFVLLGLAALRLTGGGWRTCATAVCVLSLLVSQGTAWNQVIACRLNQAVFETLKGERDRILQSERVLVDVRSFTDRIPYTWGERQGNMLDCYYGMQAFAPWGLSAMVRLAVDERKATYIGRSRPEDLHDQLRFQVQIDGHVHRPETIPKAGTFILDYERVYGNVFRNGKRERAVAQDNT